MQSNFKLKQAANSVENTQTSTPPNIMINNKNKRKIQLIANKYS